MNIYRTIGAVFNELEGALLLLRDEQYSQPSPRLFNATIGQHVRHIIELFQSLMNGYETGVVNYDLRKRDRQIETDRMLAISLMTELAQHIDMPARQLTIEVAFGSDTESITIDSNYWRELLYNLEHTIHHMALIKVALTELTDIEVSEKFGVAPATTEYRKACAQ